VSVGAIRGAEPAQATARIIGEGAEATVQLDAARGVVTKVYKRTGGAVAFDAAAREYRLLQRLARALRTVPGVSCPAPLQLIEDLPGVCMRFVEGVPLHDYVGRTRLTEAELDRIARGLASGLCAYLEVAGEPYYDFCLHNSLFQPAEAGIVLLDFGIPEPQRLLHGSYTDAQLSVGNFLGCMLYEQVRPARVRSRLARRQFASVYCGMRDRLLREGTLRGSDLRRVEEVARFTYRRLTHRGSALRRAWYRVFCAVSAVRFARARSILFSPQGEMPMAVTLDERMNYHPDPQGPKQGSSKRGVDGRCRLIAGLVDFSGKRVLDLGCSGGYFGFELAGAASSYLGIDADAVLIERNRDAARRGRLTHLRFDCAAITPSFVRSLAPVDVALFLSVFHHILAASAAYEWNRRPDFDPFDLLRALRERTGVLVFETGYPDEGFEWCARLPAMEPNPRAWVERTLREAGFGRVKVVPASAYQGPSAALRRRAARALGYARHPRPLGGRIASRLLAVDPRDGRDLFIAWPS